MNDKHSEIENQLAELRSGSKPAREQAEDEAGSDERLR